MGFIEHNVSLAGHCRFHVGGPADYFLRVSSEQELVFALNFARAQSMRYFVFGGGTNLFFDDAGFRGLAIRISNGGWQLDPVRLQVTAGAGCDLSQLVRELAQRNLGGLEFLGNIPGSVGGAVVGNAGCYGRGVADVLVRAELYDTVAGSTITVEPAFFEYSYRHSRLKFDPRYVVLQAVLNVEPRTSREVLAEVGYELAQRQRKHPHDAWCAGSYFKNPSRERPAWKVITEAGLAAARVGDAMLSPLHANFLINAGRASSAEIIELTRLIQAGVRERCGIELEPEVRFVGPEGVVPI